jgi:hypothetical protein
MFAGFGARKRTIRRAVTVVMASATLVVPLTTLSAPVASASGGRPVVLAAHASPPSLPNVGGTVTAIGKVSDAATCHLAVLGDHGIKVGLPEPAACANGSYRARVGLGPDLGQQPVVVKLGLFASRPGAPTALGVFYVAVAGNPAHPAILSARAYPWELPAKGQWTTIDPEFKTANLGGSSTTRS